MKRVNRIPFGKYFNLSITMQGEVIQNSLAQSLADLF